MMAQKSDAAEAPPIGSPLLEVENLRKHFYTSRGFFAASRPTVRAVEDVSFTVPPGQVLGLVGESGSGKTTVGRSVLRLVEPSGGVVRFEGVDIIKLSRRKMREYRRKMQIVFQDPFASLNPRMTVGDIVIEPLRIHGLVPRRMDESIAVDLLERVGLSAGHLRRYPHEFSGGQRQRIGIARALSVNPAMIVADEPVSALDVSIQAQIINLFQRLRREFNLSLLFIAHDLSVVEYISDKVMVMYLGKVMEIAPVNELFADPVHPYTQALLSAVPIPDPTVKRKRTILPGDIPSPMSPPSGCVFRTRCPIAVPDCARIEPKLEPVGPEHFKACIRCP